MHYSNSSPIIGFTALMLVVSAHLGGGYALANYFDRGESYQLAESSAASLTLHQFNLLGEDPDGALTDRAVAGNPDNFDEMIEEMPDEEEMLEEIADEIVDDTLNEDQSLEDSKEDSKEELNEESIEDEALETADDMEEATVEELPKESLDLIATDEKQEEPVAQVIKEEPKIEPKPEPIAEPKPVPRPKPAPKPVAKPQPKPTPPPQAAPLLASNKVFSESELRVLNKPSPIYPRQAARRRMSGIVTLVVSINESGAATGVRVERSSGHNVLDQAAQKAGQQIRLEPYRINGQAIAVNVRVSYEFEL